MTESDHGAPVTVLSAEWATDLDQAIASLREEGADRFDPVRFHYITALATRVRAHHGHVRRILEQKATGALKNYRLRFEKSRDEARNNITLVPESPLASLVRDIGQQTADKGESGQRGNGIYPADLKAIRYFKRTWEKLSVDKKLRRAFDQGPENAGPLNSHMLVLRSLSLMRDISPDYLSRFVSYVDSLLWLDQANKTSKPGEQNSLRRKRHKQ